MAGLTNFYRNQSISHGMMPVKLPERFLGPGFISSQTNTKLEQLSGSIQHLKPDKVSRPSATQTHGGVHSDSNDTHYPTPATTVKSMPCKIFLQLNVTILYNSGF